MKFEVPHPIVTIDRNVNVNGQLVRRIATERIRAVLVRADQYNEHMTMFGSLVNELSDELGMLLVRDTNLYYADSDAYCVLEFWFVGDEIGDWANSCYDADTKQTTGEAAMRLSERFGCRRPTAAALKPMSVADVARAIASADDLALDALVNEIMDNDNRVELDDCVMLIESNRRCGILRVATIGAPNYHVERLWGDE
ncbi:MAG: hypothetical protein AB7D39_17310 [Pseudodesulfovibrio sp.]|uniref:hypothetical protein n=1 Tax=Pseudodesulfovibrio sp. TaxID=2035812 RepID=UPI003D0BCD5D